MYYRKPCYSFPTRSITKLKWRVLLATICLGYCCKALQQCLEIAILVCPSVQNIKHFYLLLWFYEDFIIHIFWYNRDFIIHVFMIKLLIINSVTLLPETWQSSVSIRRIWSHDLSLLLFLQCLIRVLVKIEMRSMELLWLIWVYIS